MKGLSLTIFLLGFGCRALGADGSTFNDAVPCDKYLHGKGSTITEPGKYCFAQDEVATCAPEILRWENNCTSLTVSINSDNVVLDLQGHTLEGIHTGVAILGRGRNISILNGTLRGEHVQIRLNAHKSAVAAHMAMPKYDLRSQQDPEKLNVVDASKADVLYVDLDKPPQVTKFRIEDLRIESDVANTVLLSGSQNVVRGNHISTAMKRVPATKTEGQLYLSEPQVAILNYGPASVVEYNSISVRVSGQEAIPAYVVYLRNAAESIIRSNSIQVSGDRRNVVAIGLRDSEDVVIYNNATRGPATTIGSIRSSVSDLHSN